MPRIAPMSAVLIVVSIVAVSSCSFITTIPPDDMTNTAMGETMVRIHMNMSQHRDYPADLAVLPKRETHMNRITDGWGRPLTYEVDDGGIITLRSLGRDGVIRW